MRRRNVFLVWAVIVVVLSISFMTLFVNPVVHDAAGAKIETFTTKAVNRAIANVVTVGTYRELTDIRYDSNGKITSVSTNMLQINGISSDIAIASQGFIDFYAAQGITVPLGTFTGIPILAGRGPGVGLRTVPVGSVHCDFDSVFIGQGINQTLHRIVLKVKTVVNLIMPLGSRNVNAEVQVLLCESVIIGEVPEIFLTR